jgi:hypothetical protein
LIPRPAASVRTVVGFGVVFAITLAAGDALWSQAPAGTGRGAAAPGAPPAGPVTLNGPRERVKVRGKSHEGNLLGE